MAAPPYQKFFWGSYHKHTAHLRDARDHGAYLLLIGALWNNDGKLPADDETLAAFAKLTPKEWAIVRPKLMPLFRVVRGKLTQPRVTEDLAKYESTSGKRKEAGKAGGKASAGKRYGNPPAIASILPTKPEPEPEPKEERSIDLFVSTAPPPETPARQRNRTYPVDFEIAWKAYPHFAGRSSKPDACAEWKRLPLDERTGLVGAILRFTPKVPEVCGGKGAPDMARWLKHGKHLAWIGTQTGPAGADWPDSRWAQAVTMWRDGGGWGESLGPKPGEPGCRVPPHLLIQANRSVA